MCLFPYKNYSTESTAYRKGLETFDCGYCPECLSKRSRLWALRCYYHAKLHDGVMVTLTYDQYKRDEEGNILIDPKTNQPIEEVDTRPCSVRDCQLFIKRLRKKFAGKKVSYLLCAEHGKSTYRSHYHAILFGVSFTDKVFYKKSKRGNKIYKSATLTRLWGQGICTVDSVNITPQIARYCTKYCAKERGQEDTFMLVSQGLGQELLEKNFNGKSYMISGKEYPIPRQIWNRYIMKKYKKITGRGEDVTENFYTYKYVSYEESIKRYGQKIGFSKWVSNFRKRAKFSQIKENDKEFQEYIKYWKDKAEKEKPFRKNDFDRLLCLDESKYHCYKYAVLRAMEERHKKCGSFRRYIPGFGFRYVTENDIKPPRKPKKKVTCREVPCHNTTSDTKKRKKGVIQLTPHAFFDIVHDKIVKLSEDSTLKSPF